MRVNRPLENNLESRNNLLGKHSHAKSCVPDTARVFYRVLRKNLLLGKRAFKFRIYISRR